MARRNHDDGRLGDMTAGLVLEGGGMRGLYTAGVLDVFMEHGVSSPMRWACPRAPRSA